GLSRGEYSAEINITSNDPVTPLLTVPVDMLVIVGIEEHENISLLVYSNPATNAVNLQSNDDIVRILVMNSIGMPVYEEKVSDEKKVTLNTSNYETGIYIVRIETKKGFFTTKVTITK
ncbi:MAG: T9SS type A sorting domain-containing protein, partial [Bacteroidales bacterium]|nr:T9SS type A sorting domain-containing protein [Bacteroidales bacterium]